MIPQNRSPTSSLPLKKSLSALLGFLGVIASPGLARATVFDLAVTPLIDLIPPGRTGITYGLTSLDTAIFNPPIHGHLDPAIDGAGADIVGVHLPTGFSDPAKTGYDVVILMHGGGQNSDDAWGWIPNSERNAGVVYVFPNAGTDPYRVATGQFWTSNGGIFVGTQGCEGDHDPGCWSDTARLLELKDALLTANPGKLSGRFYLGGFSSGATEALQMLCYASDAFEGYIAFSAEPQFYSKDTCGEVYGDPLGPVLPPVGTPERDIADNFFIATGRYPALFGVNASLLKAPAQILKHIRPMYLAFGSEDDKAMNGLPLDPLTKMDTETGPMQQQFLPWIPGENDESSFVDWIKDRLNLTVGWQDTRSILGAGLPCETAISAIPGTCTIVSNGAAGVTLSLYRLASTGARFDVEAIEFIVNSLGTAGAVGVHHTLGYVQARGGGHMVPSPNAAAANGFSRDYSAVALAIAFMINHGGLIRVP